MRVCHIFTRISGGRLEKQARFWRGGVGKDRVGAASLWHGLLRGLGAGIVKCHILMCGKLVVRWWN